MNATWSVKYDISFWFYPISKNRQSGPTVNRAFDDNFYIQSIGEPLAFGFPTKWTQNADFWK